MKEFGSKKSPAQLDREIAKVLTSGGCSGCSDCNVHHHTSKEGPAPAPRMRTSSHARILRSDDFGRYLEVRAPAVRLVSLPVGAKDKYGVSITEYTPEWARIAQEPIAEDVLLERPRQSGHEIEGYVRIGGKRYSAFTSGGSEVRTSVGS